MNGFAEQIKRSVTMRQVCEMYGVEVNRAGFACCIWHNDRKPSMKVYDCDRGCHCFSCGNGGSVIDFVMQYFNLTFHGALDKINMDFSLGLPIGKKLTPAEQKRSSIACAVRNRSIIAAKNEQKRLQECYNAALDRFTALDKRLQEGALKSEVGGVVDDDYIEAMTQIDQARAELDEAETRLWEYENRNKM